MSNSELLVGPTFCLITGASRGIGRQLAIDFAAKLAPNSHLLLLARNGQHLAEVRNEIGLKSSHVKVFIHAADLGKPDSKEYGEMIKSATSGAKPSDFRTAIIVHNAATMGDGTKQASEMTNVEHLTDYYVTNVVSCIALNSVFLQIFSKQDVKQHIIINVSSGVAYKPVAGTSIYSAGKAARDTFFRVLALEEPDFRILSFSPGPVLTDLQREVQTTTWNKDLRQWMEDGVSSGGFLTTEQCVKPLFRALEENKFASGAYMEYTGEFLTFEKLDFNTTGKAK